MSHISEKKVVVAMSGGVDSSVCAWLLKKAGYRVEAVFIKSWEEDDNEKHCSAENDLADAKSVCDSLCIKLHTVNFSYEYWNSVFVNCLKEYRAGRTPNPDILCNKNIKFKTFLEFACEDLNADFIATGHYVRCIKRTSNLYLGRGLDTRKDQSYFLYTLNNTQLKQCLFPIGDLTKARVRNIASELGLSTATKKDSTGICFIGKRKFRDFISRYLLNRPGPIVSVDGEEVGHHLGVEYYTLGQRKGLGIGGCRNSGQDPWYVVDKDISNRTLVVAQGRNHPRLMSIGMTVGQIHWINPPLPNKELHCTVKIRYRQPDIVCSIVPIPDGSFRVMFKEPVCAVTPGQSAVFYFSEICLGGGIVEERYPLSY